MSEIDSGPAQPLRTLANHNRRQRRRLGQSQSCKPPFLRPSPATEFGSALDPAPLARVVGPGRQARVQGAGIVRGLISLKTVRELVV